MNPYDPLNQAFPLPNQYDPTGKTLAEGQVGMTLRDYFAAHAVYGQLCYLTEPAEYKKIAANAYGIADAMLEERRK